MGSDTQFFINKDGELCSNSENHSNIQVTVEGLYAPRWTMQKLETYVLKWGQYELIRGIKKAVIK